MKYAVRRIPRPDRAGEYLFEVRRDISCDPGQLLLGRWSSNIQAWRIQKFLHQGRIDEERAIAIGQIAANARQTVALLRRVRIGLQEDMRP